MCAVLAPANVPRDIVMRLNAAIVKIVNTPEMKEAFVKQGLDPATTTPENFGAFIQNEVVQKWLEGNPPKKIIYVKNKMINVVV